MSDRSPEIRFPQFDEPWKSVRLGDIASFSKGKGVSKADVHENGATKCIRYGELYTHYSEIPREIKSATDVPVKELTLSHANDVLIPASGESAIDLATATCLPKSGIAIGSDINIIRSELDGAFLAYYLNNTVKHDIAKFAQGISVMHLYAAQLKLLKLRVPSNKNETKKLGEFFSTLDEKIRLLKEKHTQLQQYKKGVIQKLLSQEIRFKDDYGQQFPDWKEVCFRDFVVPRNEIASSDENLPLASLTISNGIEAKSTRYIRDFLINDESNAYKRVHSGDFVVNPMNVRIGAVAQNRIGELIKISKYYDVFSVTEIVDANFLAFYLLSEEMMRTYHKTATGTLEEKKRVHFSEFLKFKKRLPCKTEQKKIAAFLQTLDKKLDAVQQQIDLTQTFKKGLLQQMFV